MTQLRFRRNVCRGGSYYRPIWVRLGRYRPFKTQFGACVATAPYNVEFMYTEVDMQPFSHLSCNAMMSLIDRALHYSLQSDKFVRVISNTSTMSWSTRFKTESSNPRVVSTSPTTTPPTLTKTNH